MTKQTPKTLYEFKSDYIAEFGQCRKIDLVIQDTWNAATEATRAEYDDKIDQLKRLHQQERSQRSVNITKQKEEIDRIKAEYDDKIKAMQAEIDKRDMRIKELEWNFASCLHITQMVSANTYTYQEAVNLVEKIFSSMLKPKELNQRGEDE